LRRSIEGDGGKNEKL
jgi:hypothetical protein